MAASHNFVYDSTGNLVEDKSKHLKISYDWREMPVEFVRDVSDANDAYKLVMAYDGSGRRISKTRMRKNDQHGYWYTDHVTHYTGIGTEVRESFRRAASPEVDVVVNMPNGLGRYGVEDAAEPFKGIDKEHLAGYIPSAKFEWYLKNHLGSTMLVYGTAAYDDSYFSNFEGGVKAAYDYRAFGEMIELTPPPTDKVTENFTGKEHDDEIALDYFGARYLDPMLGLWTSVDPARQFASPYLYAGNGMNPINVVDPDGNYSITQVDDQYVSQNGKYHYQYASLVETVFYKVYDLLIPGGGLMTSSKPDLEIENSLRPSVRSGLFGAILDALTFIPFLRPASIPLSASEKTLKEVKNFNDLICILL